MFQVPASKASIGQDKFEFEVAGKKYSVKKFGCLTIEEQLFIRSEDSTEQDVLDLVWGKKGTKQGDLVRGLEADQFEALRDAWIDESGVTPGESDGSSES